MKILYDHQMFSIQKYGGITRYFCELIKNLPSEHQFNLSLIFSDNHYIQENREIFKKMNFLPDKNFKGKHFIKEKLYFINQIYSRYCISSNNFDLFHPTYYDNYFLKSLKRPYILTVHDLILIKFKDNFFKYNRIRSQMEIAIKNANRIISVSENTKKDLVEIFNLNPEIIDVIYHGFNKRSNNKSQTNKIIDNFGRYILFVGNRSLYKNFKTFTESVSKLLKREKGVKLVCVGTPFTNEEKVLLSNLRIANQTIALNVDNSTLNDLYSNALVFVYPSLYEGFGMPILEAYANNCPVCLSNTSCFPEIAQNAGIFFDPNDHESILSAIEKVIYDNDCSKEIVIAGQNRLASFSWEKAAKETISSYNKAI
jgi:glycosyltransferase involved in cell wall biosynthesis